MRGWQRYDREGTTGSPEAIVRGARTTFNGMTGGNTVAMCKGGSWVLAGNAAKTIHNPRCGLTSSGAVIHATVDANYQTIPTGTVAPGTFCTWRDYQASWGGTNKPYISKPVVGDESVFHLFLGARTTMTAGMRSSTWTLMARGPRGSGGAPTPGTTTSCGVGTPFGASAGSGSSSTPEDWDNRRPRTPR